MVLVVVLVVVVVVVVVAALLWPILIDLQTVNLNHVAEQNLCYT